MKQSPFLLWYHIREDGVIINTNTGKELKVFIDPRGYKQVTIKGKTYKIHRLLAVAFIPNPENYPIINHKDGNKLNNDLDNLEWCTYSYNTRHGFSIGLYDKVILSNKLDNKHKKKVLQIKDGKPIKEFDSMTEAAIAVDGIRSGISGCVRGKYKTYMGYEWILSPDVEKLIV